MSRQRSRTVRRPVLLTALLLLLGALTCAASASAAVVVGGGCTLQEAVAAANNHADANGCTGVAPSGQTTISVPDGHYTLSGELKVTASMKLVGDGESSTIIDGGGVTRVFEVTSSGTLALESLDVTGGKSIDGANGVTSGVCSEFGAGSHIGAGCPGGRRRDPQRGRVSLDHVLVTGNPTGRGRQRRRRAARTATAARSATTAARGGLDRRSLIVTASTISDNQTGGGGKGGDGAAARAQPRRSGRPRRRERRRRRHLQRR